MTIDASDKKLKPSPQVLTMKKRWWKLTSPNLISSVGNYLSKKWWKNPPHRLIVSKMRSTCWFFWETIDRRGSQHTISRHTISMRIFSSNFMRRIYLLPARTGLKNFYSMPANSLSKVSPISLKKVSSTGTSRNLTYWSTVKTTSKS